jgi:hypothetical protein
MRPKSNDAKSDKHRHELELIQFGSALHRTDSEMIGDEVMVTESHTATDTIKAWKCKNCTYLIAFDLQRRLA